MEQNDQTDESETYGVGHLVLQTLPEDIEDLPESEELSGLQTITSDTLQPEKAKAEVDVTEERAAVRIQSAFRGMQARGKVAAMKNEKVSLGLIFFLIF